MWFSIGIMNWPAWQKRGPVSVCTKTTNAEMFVSENSLKKVFKLHPPMQIILVDSSLSGWSEYLLRRVFQQHLWHFKLGVSSRQLVQLSTFYEF